MDQELLKGITVLIDETLNELEELKKSDRFSASQIKLEGPGSGIAGKDPNGSLSKEEDDEEDKKDDKDEDKDMSKEEDKDMCKEEDDKDDDDDKDDKKEDMKKSEDLEEVETLKKSHQEEIETLKKSYDEKLVEMQTQIETLTKSVIELADTPLDRKGVSFNEVETLEKSVETPESLNKSQVVDQLMDLKKSGKSVETEDIISLDFGGQDQLVKIANKYGIK